jgi:hypothetical protein
MGSRKRIRAARVRGRAPKLTATIARRVRTVSVGHSAPLGITAPRWRMRPRCVQSGTIARPARPRADRMPALAGILVPRPACSSLLALGYATRGTTARRARRTRRRSRAQASLSTDPRHERRRFPVCPITSGTHARCRAHHQKTGAPPRRVSCQHAGRASRIQQGNTRAGTRTRGERVTCLVHSFQNITARKPRRLRAGCYTKSWSSWTASAPENGGIHFQTMPPASLYFSSMPFKNGATVFAVTPPGTTPKVNGP